MNFQPLLLYAKTQQQFFNSHQRMFVGREVSLVESQRRRVTQPGFDQQVVERLIGHYHQMHLLKFTAVLSHVYGNHWKAVATSPQNLARKI